MALSLVKAWKEYPPFEFSVKNFGFVGKNLDLFKKKKKRFAEFVIPFLSFFFFGEKSVLYVMLRFEFYIMQYVCIQ